MEIRQSTTRIVHRVNAEHGRWNISASVAIEDSKVQSIEGLAQSEGAHVTFSCNLAAGQHIHNVYNVAHGYEDVYGIIAEYVDSVLNFYEEK